MTPTLFDDLPAPARTGDPQTSHDAAAMPHLPAQRIAVLTALVALTEATAWDIAHRLNGPESGTVRSRLNELAHSGYAAKTGTTAAGDRGAANTLWTATDLGRQVAADIGAPVAHRQPSPSEAH